MDSIVSFQTTSTDSPIGFEHRGDCSAGLFTRYLTLHGERAYELSFSCGTCYFLFERLPGANSAVDIHELDNLLRASLTRIDSEIIEKIAPILPAGTYTPCLRTVTPKLVAPCSEHDYFSHEQITLWGVDPFWGLPHYPNTEYYRTLTKGLGDGAALFEFVVPMVPKNWLDKDTVAAYTEDMQQGAQPTAIAISTLDIKQPAEWEGDPAITAHYCQAHFLLDGHHKCFAASQIGKPITLLSFVARDECIASSEEIDKIILTVAHAG